MTAGAVIHVVAGAVIRPDGRVLIAQRPVGKPLAGGWEFPGGKLEPGEGRAAGLARELHEELGIEIRAPRPLMRVRHEYVHGSVRLDMWVVTDFQGEPQSRDGQTLRWLTQDELASAELLPADRPLVRALRLPDRLRQPRTDHYIVDGAGPCALGGVSCARPEDARIAVRHGADFIVFRGPLSDEEAAAACEYVEVPFYVRAPGLEAAFRQGATGLNELADSETCARQGKT